MSEIDDLKAELTNRDKGFDEGIFFERGRTLLHLSNLFGDLVCSDLPNSLEFAEMLGDVIADVATGRPLAIAVNIEFGEDDEDGIA